MTRALLCVLALAFTASFVSCEKILGRREVIPTDNCGATAISSDDGRIYLFTLSEDSVVWFKYQKAEGGWSSWKSLSGHKAMGSGPKPVKFEDGTIQVYARGPDRQFYVSTLTNVSSWSEWSSPFSKQKFNSPPVPVLVPSGRVLVFGTAIHNSESSLITKSNLFVAEVSQDKFDASANETGFEYGDWLNLKGDLTSSPAVMVDSEAMIHVFARGLNRALWHIAEAASDQSNVPSTKAWGSWECLGGVLASSPSVPATLNGVNLVEVYVRAADKQLWLKPQIHNDSQVNWGEWKPLGGMLSSAPSVGLSDDGMIEVFSRATDKALYFKAQSEDSDGQMSFSQWHTMGGMFSTGPTVMTRADGMFDVFVRGVDKAIWHAHQMEVNGTRTFSSWHSLGGHSRKFAC